MFIKSILQEELNNSLQMKEDYERELANLPKGSLVKKKIKRHEYYYLVLREAGKVKFVYKGVVSEAEILQFQEIKKTRAKYRNLLSQIKKQIKFLRSSLRGKQAV